MITELKEKILNFPDSCGVYIMKDSAGKPLYVGKAQSLKNRVLQYLPPSSDNRYFIGLLARDVADIELIITSNEREAFLLENELIKKFKPKYNVRLRDDKNYISVRIDKDSEYPRIDIVRSQKRDGAIYFGPFVRSREIRELIKLLRVYFKIRICKDTEFKQRKRPCIQYQIKRCDAPCIDKSEELKKRYTQNIERCIRILSGKDKEIVEELRREMQRLSDEYLFEEAAQIRDIIKLIDSRSEVQNIINIEAPDMDIFGFEKNENRIALFIFKFRDGRIISERSFLFEDIYQSESEMFEDILPRLYHNSDDVPDEIIIPVDIELDINSLINREKKVSIKNPKSGFRFRLLQLARKNAEYRMQEYLNKNSLLYRIKSKFGLKNLPEKIECYDISHIAGRYTVGSKVVAINGELYKDEYRRYKIETATDGDDYLALYEVITRRLAHTEESYPDLILVDGGRGQLAAVMKAMSAFENTKDIDVLGIAKERGEKYNRIYRAGSKNYINLDDNSDESRLLILLRDEAHRFANDYRERLYKKENI